MVKFSAAQLQAICYVLNIMIKKVPSAVWHPLEWEKYLRDAGIPVHWNEMNEKFVILKEGEHEKKAS